MGSFMPYKNVETLIRAAASSRTHPSPAVRISTRRAELEALVDPAGRRSSSTAA
jgi:hypothetical protein